MERLINSIWPENTQTFESQILAISSPARIWKQDNYSCEIDTQRISVSSEGSDESAQKVQAS